MNAPEPYQQRLVRLYTAMDLAGVGAYLCDHGEMLAWLTGYSVSETYYRACVIPRQGEPVWVLRRIDELPCRAATWLTQVQTYADHNDPFGEVAQAISQTGAHRIGVDFQSYGFTVHTYNRLSQMLPGAEFIDLPRASDLLRAVKDEGEISKLRQAADIGQGALNAIVRNLCPGDTARMAAANAAAFYLCNGADDYWVGPVSISRRAEGQGHEMGFLHAPLQEEQLETGDVLHVELVPRVSNYSARFMRSIKLGDPSDEENQIMSVLVSLQNEQFRMMRPGIRANQVDAILRQGLKEAGLRRDFANISGYMTGLYTRTPRSSDTALAFHPGANWVLEENQVFHIYATAAGLAISETVVVRPNGAELLTSAPRGIIVARH